MNPQSTGLKVASALFGVIGLLQLIRLLAGWEVIINHREVPLAVSGVAVVVLGGLSLWLFRLSRGRAE
jgi:hypothetical protein